MTIRIRLSLILTYFLFAILLNSVGSVILQSITSFGVSKVEASWLEGFKDLSIAAVSFLVAAWLPRFGYRRAMITGLLIVAAASVAMRLLESFDATKLMFLATGVSFALVKVSVYASIGLVTANRYEHAGLLNQIEGMFMVGVLTGYFLFGHFIGDTAAGDTAWLDVYWVLAILSLMAASLLFFTPFPEQPARIAGAAPEASDFVGMLKLCALPMVLVFVISAFLYVLIEQGLGTWLPTFNREVLKLPQAMSVEAASIFAGSLAIGRLSAGVIMRRVSWYPVLNICVIAMAALVLLTLPLTHGIEIDARTNWFHAPLAAYIFPLIGLFMAPIYPAINSVMLSALPQAKHAAMTGLIVVFSALGGTTGSRITGEVFERFSGQTAFYFSLVPMLAILIALYFFRQQARKMRGEDGAPS